MVKKINYNIDLKEVGETINEDGKVITIFECKKCKWRTSYPEKHKCKDGKE